MIDAKLVSNLHLCLSISKHSGMMKVAIILAIFATLATSTPLWSEPDVTSYVREREEDATYRLNEEITPLSYEIKLIPYFEDFAPDKNFTFDGTVKIEFSVALATSEIKMHVYDINIDITTVKFSDSTGPLDIFESLVYNDTDDRQFLNISLNTALTQNQKYFLEMKYTGKLNDALSGFYRSKYIGADGVEKYMLITQFERVGARRAFPCFDEPKFKAYFTVWIAHEATKHPTILSNMPLESDSGPVENLPATWTWAKFPKSSEVMPTYLLAFSVSDFNPLVHPEDDTYKVWARDDLAETQGHYANNLAPKIVHYMETFTGHNYSLPKIDQMAIPDFASGAMENWGLITYRESRLLYDEGVSSTNDRQRIEAVVTHELTHQWFGNIATCEWWSHIWLNEGFATYFEYHALATIQDTWQLEQQFVYQEMHSVLLTDALNSTHPMNTVVDSPASASAAFDNVAYNKGGCIIRYMEYFLGDEIFKEGLNNYLSDREFKPAVPDDLWNAMNSAISDPSILPAGKTFKDVMEPWDLQPGYPVVTVTRNYAAKTANITQQRFVTQGEPGDYLWYIALTYTTQTNPDFENLKYDWITATETEITDFDLPDNLEDNHWLLFNVKEVGYYRVNYDKKNWELLSSDQLQLHPINRAQIMDDALALARVSMVEYPTALDTTEYLNQETEYVPWGAGLTATGYIWDRLNFRTDSRELFEMFMLSKMDLIYDVVNGFTLTEDDSHIMNLKRSLVLKWACEYGHDECNTEATRLFQLWSKTTDPDTNNPIDPDLKSVVYCAGMKNGGREEYNFLFKRYETAVNNAGEQSLILTALGCSSDPDLLQEYLDESIAENSRIRSQDARSVHTAVYGNYLGVDLALDFIILNWERCETVYSGANNVARAFTGVSTKCNTQEQRTKLEELHDENDDPGTKMDPVILEAIEDSIITVEESIAWHETHSEAVLGYLMEKFPASGATTFAVTPALLVTVLMALWSQY